MELMSGSLLGAVRHHGTIPFDEDMDSKLIICHEGDKAVGELAKKIAAEDLCFGEDMKARESKSKPDT